MAVEYAHSYAYYYPWIAWLSAQTKDALAQSCRRLAYSLDLPHADDFASLRDELSHRIESSGDAWLLIIDAVGDPRSIGSFIPSSRLAHVLMTSQNPRLDNAGVYTPLRLEPLTIDDAVQFMLLRTERVSESDQEELAAVKKLAHEELGCLPLALEQAAAHIAHTQSRFVDYLESFHTRGVSLLEVGIPARYPGSLVMTLSRTLEHLSQSACAVELARLIAFLDEEDLPVGFLTTAARQLGEDSAKRLESVASDPLAVDELMIPLFDYSLVRRDRSTNGYRMHNLLRRVISDLTPPHLASRFEDAAVNACSLEIADRDLFSSGLETRGSANGYPSAFRALFEGVASVETARLLGKVGDRLLNDGAWEEAGLCLERSLQILEERFGPKSSELARTLLYLAILANVRSQGNAVDLYCRVLELADSESQSDVRAVALNNLGEIWRKRRRWDLAEELLTQSTAARLRMFGAMHSSVATALNNLGNLSGERGDYEGALNFYRQSYEIRVALLKAPDPFLANSLNNLGWAYLNLNRLGQAEKPLRRALAMSEELYGPTHPEVATTLRNLAALFANKGQRKKAFECLERASSITRTMRS